MYKHDAYKYKRWSENLEDELQIASDMFFICSAVYQREHHQEDDQIKVKKKRQQCCVANEY